VRRLADDLAGHGVRHYALQQFRAEGCANAALVRDEPQSFLTEHFGAAIAPRFASFELRRAT
jgi:hypothetical protein